MKSILEREGFYYEITDGIIANVGGQFYGPLVKPQALYHSSGQGFVQGKYNVENDQLFLESLAVCVKTKDLGNVSKTFSKHMTIEHHKRVSSPSQQEELAVIRFSNLRCRVTYSGTIYGRQSYTDEVIKKDDGKITLGTVHEQQSIFVFKEGILDISKSRVFQSDDTFIEKHMWKQENYQAYLENAKAGKAACRELFFIDPEGTYQQNICLISVAINYGLHNIKTDSIVASILGYAVPVFRTSYIVAEGESIRKVQLDLIRMILEREDVELLKILYPYIDRTNYEKEDLKKMEAMINEAVT